MPTLPDTKPYSPNHIMIPVDGTPLTRTAIAAALAVVPAPGSLTLLHVVDRHGLAGEASLESVDTLAVDLRSRLPSTRIDTRLAQGDPTTEILDTATAIHPDLIVMATREHLAPSTPPEATVSAQVAQATSLPVLVAHANADGWHPQRILTPLDGSLRSLQALPIAAGLANRLATSVHLVAVIDPEATLPPAYAWSCPECDPDLQDALAYLQCQANDLLNQAERSLRAAGVTVTSDLLLGKTVPVLIEAIQPGDVVVMTTRGAGHRAGSHVGSVASRLLRESPAPVMVFHPRIESTVIHTTFETGVSPVYQPGNR